MCGLFGFLSLNAFTNRTNYSDKKKFATQMALYSVLRGADSTGVALCGMKDGQTMLYKKALASPDFLQLNKTENVLSQVDNATVFLGHTRSKTVGNVGDKEAHPFSYEHITMIHNGSVSNYRTLTKNCQVETDSAHIALSMAENGAKETLERLIGAFCIVWFDAKENTFNIARNKERPCFFIRVPDWEGLVFGSEIGMLGSVLDRNRIKTEGKYLYPDEYQILTWSANPGDKAEYKSVPFVERRTQLKNSSPPSTLNGTDGKLRDGSERPMGLTSTTVIGKTDAKYDTPVSKKGIQRATAKLSAFHVPYGSTWAGYPKSFIPYPKNNTGGNLGYLVVNMDNQTMQGRDAVVHNIKRSVWEKLAGEQRLLIKIVNVRTIGNRQVFIGLPAPSSTLQSLIDRDKKGKSTSREFNADTNKWEGGEPDSVQCGGPGSKSGGTGLFKGPNGLYFEREEWLDLTHEGCCVCSGELIPEDKGIVWYGNQREFPCCGKCSKDSALLESLGMYYEAPKSTSKVVN